MASLDTKRSVAELKRKLFRSPVVDIVDSERSQGAVIAQAVYKNTDNTNALLTRLQIEHDVIEVSHKMLQRDLHEQRLKQLRQKLKTLTEDDWQYVNVDKLIGLQ